MLEHEVFAEIGVAGNPRDEVMAEIGDKLEDIYPDCRKSYSILGNRVSGWTIGIEDNYLAPVAEIALKYPKEIFVLKTINSESVEVSFIRNNLIITRETELDGEIPGEDEWEYAEELEIY